MSAGICIILARETHDAMKNKPHIYKRSTPNRQEGIECDLLRVLHINCCLLRHKCVSNVKTGLITVKLQGFASLYVIDLKCQ